MSARGRRGPLAAAAAIGAVSSETRRVNKRLGWDATAGETPYRVDAVDAVDASGCGLERSTAVEMRRVLSVSCARKV